jgi:hypothetical protein
VRLFACHDSYQTSFVDHLAPLCSLLDVPYLFLDPLTFKQCKKLYPFTDLKLINPLDLLENNLIKQFDTLIYSQCMLRDEFKSNYPGMQSVFVPHGNSDKGHSTDEMRLLLEPDIVCLYGQRMIDYLKEKGVYDHLKATLITGNWRVVYWQYYKKQYEDILKKTTLNLFPKLNKRVLYAPTWDDLDGTFFKYVEKIITTLPPSYELVIKLHPYLLEGYFGKIEVIKDKFASKKNVFFLTDMPLIYPLLETIDIYIGDMSSIGYDFLYFDKPLYFVSNHKDKQFHLFNSGVLVDIDSIGSIYEREADDINNFSKKRKEIYNYTFGELLSFKQTKEVLRNGLKSLCLHQ